MLLRRLLRVPVRELLPFLSVLSCTSTEPRPRAPDFPDLPPFIGTETERWLAQDSGPVGRNDILRAFETAAKTYGCSTDKLGSEFRFTIEGERRFYYGVTATCYEGTISIITLQDGGARIGCAKPTTIQACNRLLRDISEAP